MKYAEGTTVSVEKSQAELRQILARYKTTRFGLMEEPGRTIIVFEMSGLPFRISIDLPKKEDDVFLYKTHAGTGRKTKRTPDAAYEQWERACRQKWRVMLLIIKANLEAAGMGILTPEQALMPFLVTSSGRTIMEETYPRLKEIAAKGLHFKGLLGDGK